MSVSGLRIKSSISPSLLALHLSKPSRLRLPHFVVLSVLPFRIDFIVCRLFLSAIPLVDFIHYFPFNCRGWYTIILIPPFNFPFSLKLQDEGCIWGNINYRLCHSASRSNSMFHLSLVDVYVELTIGFSLTGVRITPTLSPRIPKTNAPTSRVRASTGVILALDPSTPTMISASLGSPVKIRLAGNGHLVEALM